MLRSPILAGLVCALHATALCTGAAAAAGELRVGVATSLYEPAQAIADAFERANPGQRLRASVAASSVLAVQGLAGAPLDVLLLADAEIADRMEREGAVVARRDFARNRLVVVTRDASLVVRTPEDLAKPAIERLAIPARAVPVGRYARSWLAGRGILDAVDTKAVRTENARATLLAVDHGLVDAAIVYATDAPLARKAVMAYEVPHDEQPEIRYVAVQLERARGVAAARALVDFVTGPEAREVLARAGFAPAR